MNRNNCDACKAKDWYTVSPIGVYACHECKTVYWSIPANATQEEIREATAKTEEFHYKFDGYTEV